MSDLTILPSANSPFDRIRSTREDGTEIWSARELQEVMQYTRWGSFKIPLDRAILAASNQGHDAGHHLQRSLKVVDRVQGGGTPMEDYRLTRFVAYLVAMNGDPKKDAIAAAQAYFAVRTGVMETSLAVDAVSLTRLKLLQIAMNAETEGLAPETESTGPIRRSRRTTASSMRPATCRC